MFLNIGHLELYQAAHHTLGMMYARNEPNVLTRNIYSNKLINLVIWRFYNC
jgi:hypothetical protein